MRGGRVRNVYVRGSIGVASIVDKMKDNLLRWFGLVVRREKSEAIRTVMEMNVIGSRRRGRPKRRWLDAIMSGMRTAGVFVDVVGNRVKWRFKTRVANPKYIG